MRTIKLTREGIERVKLDTGWTPDTFMTSFGYVTIPGPAEEDYDWYDDYACGNGCCACCGCSCGYYFDEEEENGEV